MNPADTPTTLVIVGVTGDLVRRKLLPALAQLAKRGALPSQFRIIGITRQQNFDTNALFDGLENGDALRNMLELFPMDLALPEEYQRLFEKLKNTATTTQCLFYLAVPPRAILGIISSLGTSGIAALPDVKLLLEKPFGSDAANAKEMIKDITAYFTPKQIYRIDHYLAKDMIRDISPQLFAHPIKHIDIVASETIGIEGRVGFYEHTGALRDMVQSHLLQMAAVVLADHTDETFPVRRKNALATLVLAPGVAQKRGQYDTYRQEVGNSTSTVETFVSLELRSSNPRFVDIPITITTGKGLHTKKTEVTIVYKDGHKECIADHNHAPTKAYEQVLHDAIMSDKSIFVSHEEVLECWRIIAPLQDIWKTDSSDLLIYRVGNTIDSVI